MFIKKEYMKKYYQKNKNKIVAHVLKYKQTKKGNLIAKKASQKYFKTSKGKLASAKSQAKRKRNMNWILMFPNPFDESVLVDYHHITNVYVVAVPRDLHKLYYGKYHREKTMEIVKQIYLGD